MLAALAVLALQATHKNELKLLCRKSTVSEAKLRKQATLAQPQELRRRDRTKVSVPLCFCNGCGSDSGSAVAVGVGCCCRVAAFLLES